MPCFKTFAQGASALAFGCAVLAAPALADDSQLNGVKSMNVQLSGAVPVVTVRNIDATHRLGDLELAIKEHQIAVPVGAQVECLGTTSENWKWRHGYALGGGAFGIGRTTLLMEQALANMASIDHVKDTGARAFQMPSALLANPQIAIDPVAEVLAAADKAPDKLAWLRQDHVITVKIPLRVEAQCHTYSRNKLTKVTVLEGSGPGEFNSYLTKDVNLKIEYKGDSQLYTPADNTPKLNAQLGQGQGLPNQIGGGYQPFKLTSMQFQPNMPHHVGACPAKTTIRLQYEGLGRGTIQISVHEGAKIIDGPHNFLYDGKNGEDYYYFDIETPKPAASDLNKTVSHNLTVRVRTKDWKSQTWDGGYAQMDQAVWKHRCTPQVNPALGGGAPGGVGGGYKKDGNGGTTPAIIRRAQ